MVTDPPVLVALDLPTAEEAVDLAMRLAPHVGGFKVGLRLLLGVGPAVVSALVGLGRPVFADAKLHDIPTQVEAAARRLGRAGARWVSVHAAGGVEMMEAAVGGVAAGAGEARAGVLAVTVLTSLDRAALARVGIDRSPGKLVSAMTRAAAAAGCEGVVCSPQELNVARDVAPGLLRVTPGVRLRPGDDDQRRTATPAEARRRGADLLVVGRPVVRAPDPVAAAAALAAAVVGEEDG